MQLSRCRQPCVVEQYALVPHTVSSGLCVHVAAKQRSVVQSMPSSQSAMLQHSAQAPPQHFNAAPHFGVGGRQCASAPHASTVQGSESLQSAGPVQALVPPVPAPPAPLPPPVAAPPLPLAPDAPALPPEPPPSVTLLDEPENSEPPQRTTDSASASESTANSGERRMDRCRASRRKRK